MRSKDPFNPPAVVLPDTRLGETVRWLSALATLATSRDALDQSEQRHWHHVTAPQRHTRWALYSETANSFMVSTLAFQNVVI